MAISTEVLSAKGLDQAQQAITIAKVTGSVGSTQTEVHIDYHGVETSEEWTKVARVEGTNATLWRVTDSSIDGITGTVLVLAGLPGRHHSHAA